MRVLRTGTPQPEMWEADDIMSHLNCDKTKAEEIMKECRTHYGLSGHGPIEKQLILDFREMKQREEREAHHKAELANVEISTTLKEQVKTLQEQVKSLNALNRASSEDARKARTQALIANFISFISFAIALIALVLKLN